MPGAYGWAAEKGLAYSFGKPFSQQKFPDLVQWVQEVCCPRLVLSLIFDLEAPSPRRDPFAHRRRSSTPA